MLIAAPGVRIGPYELLARIGAGGMGEVWRGKDTRLNRPVAVKLLPAELASDSQLRSRLEREAKMVSRLNHPHICTLYDVGDDYLVLELLDGETIEQRLRRGPMPLAEVLRYGTQVADALDKAHRQHVVHRDLKPANVMITKSGAKLLDFGIARPASSPAATTASTAPHALTAEGRVVGTLQYMSPEQLAGGSVDSRTDIFALGALLYEMATGAPAFDGPTRTAIVAAIMSGEPRPLAELRPQASPALEHVVRKCLAKEADDRWQSAHDVAEELKWIGEGGTQLGVAVAQQPAGKRLAVFASVIAALAIASAGFFAWRNAHHRDVDFAYLLPSEGPGYKWAGTSVVSPDGSRVAFLAYSTKEDNRFLWVRRLDSLAATPFPLAVGRGYPAWSPDGKRLILGGPQGMITVLADGGPPQPLGIVGHTYAVNDAGVVLYTNIGGDGIYRLDPGGSSRPLIARDAAEREDWNVVFVDNDAFLFMARMKTAAGDVNRLYGARLSDPRRHLVGELPSRFAYAPGWLFFIVHGTLVAQPFDVRTFRLSGEPLPVVDDVYADNIGFAEFSVSNNGVLICRGAAPPVQMEWFSAHGTPTGPVGSPVNATRVAISPDAKRLAVAIDDDRERTTDIWLYGINDDTRTRLTTDGRSSRPIWAPDGKRIYYSNRRSGNLDVFEARVDTTAPDRLLLGGAASDVPWSVSPDSRLLIYESWVGAHSDLRALPLDGSGDSTLVVAGSGAGSISPDGRWLAYVSARNGITQIFVRPLAGNAPEKQISPERGARPQWTPDGKRLLFRTNSRLMQVDFAPDGTVGTPRVFSDLGYLIGDYTIAADGRIVVLPSADYAADRVYVNWQRLLKR